MGKPIIIVGAGIAGLSLAFRLGQQDVPILLIDSGENHSSKVAAGIINPVVFRRMALSWRIDDLLEEAKTFYSKLEKLLNQSYFHPIPIRRAFAHQQELDLWIKKQEEPAYNSYLKKLDASDLDFKHINNGFGTGVVKNSYWVDSKKLLNDWHAFLKENNTLIYQKFDYASLNLEKKTYQNSEYDKIIFCEGYHGLENPFFNYLPLQATKGELLTIESKELLENESYNYKCFVLPIGQQQFKIGATYSWDSPDVDLTEKAKIELENHFKNLTAVPYEIIKHEAGVRPTVLDRRPLLGEHPKHKNLFIYNGLGAKGYLITPQLSLEFVDFLFGKTELDKEVDIRRYERRF